MTTIASDGYTDLPAGHVAAIATFLEMRSAPAAPPVADPSGVALRRMIEPDLERYRGLFRAVGTEWLWNSRLRLNDEALRDILRDPRVELYLPQRDGRDVGILELDFREEGEVEIAFFGLVPEAIGSGLGRWLMSRALEIAWRDGVHRVWLHNCTLDHPAALGFYIRSGFSPYARRLEMFPDPRLSGLLRREAGAHVPIISREAE